MSARTFAVFIGVTALIALLVFGLVSKGEARGAHGGRGAPTKRAGGGAEAAGFEILGIDTQETGEGGLGFVEEYGLSYPQLHDGDGNYAKDDLKTTGVPETFLVDPDGDLALALPGAITAAQLRERVAPMIEGA